MYIYIYIHAPKCPQIIHFDKPSILGIPKMVETRRTMHKFIHQAATHMARLSIRLLKFVWVLHPPQRYVEGQCKAFTLPMVKW